MSKMCADVKTNQVFRKYNWHRLLILFLSFAYLLGSLTSIIFYYTDFETASFLKDLYATLAISPVALIFFLVLQYRAVRSIEFSPGKVQIQSLARNAEYELSDLTFVQRPQSEIDARVDGDFIRIQNKAGEKLLDISSKWTEYKRLLSYLEEQNLYVSEFPTAGLGIEEGFLTQAVGDGIKLLILLMLILFLPIGIGTYGFWIAIPATLLFISLFIYWLRSP